MNTIHYGPVIVAVMAAFIASAVYYVVFSKQRAKLSPAAAATNRPNPLQMVAELVRNFVLAWVLAYLVEHLGVATLGQSFSLAVMLWIAFPVILLSGSVMYEKVPVKLAFIHAGDWIIKLLIMTSIVEVWK